MRLVTFGAPRVGCEDFKEYVEGMPNLRLSRVVENGAGIKLNLSTPRRIDRASLDVIDAT